MQSKGLRPRVPGGFSFIESAFDIALKLTQQISKNCRQTRRQQNAYHPQKPGPIDTRKICFDTFRPVNVVNSDLNLSLTSNILAITRSLGFRIGVPLIFQVSVN